MTLGSAVKRLRAAAGYSQGEFASRLDISQSYLSQIERERREPTIPLLRTMAEVLGVPAVILFAAALSRPSNLQEEQRQQLDRALHELVEAVGMNILQTSLSLNAAGSQETS